MGVKGLTKLNIYNTGAMKGTKTSTEKQQKKNNFPSFINLSSPILESS